MILNSIARFCVRCFAFGDILFADSGKKYAKSAAKTAPNLLNRDFHAEKPNQKWVTDVTEFRLFGEKLYLSPILDLHSSDLVSYTVSDRPVLSMVTTMLDKAFAKMPDGTTL